MATFGWAIRFMLFTNMTLHWLFYWNNTLMTLDTVLSWEEIWWYSSDIVRVSFFFSIQNEKRWSFSFIVLFLFAGWMTELPVPMESHWRMWIMVEPFKSYVTVETALHCQYAGDYCYRRKSRIFSEFSLTKVAKKTVSYVLIKLLNRCTILMVFSCFFAYSKEEVITNFFKNLS